MGLANALHAVALVLLAVAASHVSAHIKMFYNPWRLAIRTGLGQTSDGVFSAANNQPCGGNQNWGRGGQRRYTRVVDGQRLCTRVNWNGGHKNTPTENKLRAMFACGGLGNAQDLLQQSVLLPLVDGTNPAPEANGFYVDGAKTNANYDGYTLCVDLPPKGITADISENDGRRMCTLAVVEGNTWGNCVDLLLHATGTMEPLTPAPVPSASQYAAALSVPVALNASEGTYKLNSCFVDTGGKCCLTGFFGVRNNGAVSARFFGNGDFGLCIELVNGYRDYQTILKPSKQAADVLEGNMYLYMGWDQFGRYVEPQNMSITMRDGGSMYFSNVGLDLPYVADHDITYFASLENGLTLGLIPWPNYSYTPDTTNWDYIVAGIVGGIAVLYLVGGVLLNKATTGYCEHPHIHALLVQLGCVRKRRKKVVVDDDDIEKPIQTSKPVSKPKSGFSLTLPPNWQSAVDSMSGEVYYFNTQTKETRWERPLQ